MEADLLPGDTLVMARNKPIGATFDETRSEGRRAVLLLIQRRTGAERYVALAIP